PCRKNPQSKNMANASTTRVMMRSRSASPTLMFLTDTRSGMIALGCRWSVDHPCWMDMAACAAHAHRALCDGSQFAAKRAAVQYHRWIIDGASGGRAKTRLFLAPPLY